MHFAIDPGRLRSLCPLDLDLFRGEAYLSLVAFTQARLRPAIGGRLAEGLATPLARHEFLNVRTYVRHAEYPAIYFLAEWIPNRFAILLGPTLYGLPYRFGKADYSTNRSGTGHRRLDAGTARFDCRFSWDSAGTFHRSAPGTLDDFLLERYSAFTRREGILRRLDIAHTPWLQTPAAVRIHCSRLIPGHDLWNPCRVHYSPGVDNVGIGMPTHAQSSYAIQVGSAPRALQNPDKPPSP